MSPSSSPISKTPIALACVLIWAVPLTVSLPAEAKPKKVVVVDCDSNWTGVNTPEYRHCEDMIAFDKGAHPNDPETWHYLQCFSNGTAQCCTGAGVCTSVRSGSKLVPGHLLDSGPTLQRSP